MSGTGDTNFQRHLEQSPTPPLKKSDSSERLAQLRRQDEQLAALQRGSNEIDAQRIATASHGTQMEQHLEKGKPDEELSALKKEVQDIQKKVADRGAYDYERANANFDLRYETDPPQRQAGGWVLVTSRVRVSSETRKGLTERKLGFDFQNRFHIEKREIEVLKNYRDVDKDAQIEGTNPMFFSDILQQQARHAGADLSFKPLRIRAKDVYEEDTLKTVDSLENAKGQKIKKGSKHTYTEKDKNFYRLLLTKTGKSRLNYQGVHYPQAHYSTIHVDRGHKKDRIDQIDYHLKYDDE
jgi:hypothetical protein